MQKKDFIPIRTERLIIDEFKTSDFEALQEIAFKINDNADAHFNDGYCPFYTFQVAKEEENRANKIRQKVADFIIKAGKERDVEPRSTYRMAVRLKDGTLIGNTTIDMLPIQEDGKTIYGDLGYFINPEYGSQGYATEAVRGLAHHFFKKYNKLDVTTHPNNKFSQNLIKRIGGKEVGYKEASHYGNSEPRVIFEVDKKDFYQNCAFNQKMPDLLTILINRQQKR
ncbi:MAG: GNAT family N-acetyltransferase [Alphaproteobacteria bacterium]|nr:GNAT family N-acetyltransferase [Alphaproteobacteria bacterium]